MKTNPHPQGSVEWLQARAGIPTASEFDNLITPEGKVRTGQMPKSYLAAKLAEWWQGGVLAQFNSFDMEQGRILEEEAIPYYELETGQEIRRVGLCTTDDKRIGCSPDGLLGDDSGIEIKCPRMETHVGYLLDGGLPKQYVAQVHGAMLVTGYPEWKFLSYCRRMPPLLLTVPRDDELQDALKCALEMFLESFDAGKEKLCELNGGPPERRVAPMPAAADIADPNDITP